MLVVRPKCVQRTLNAGNTLLRLISPVNTHVCSDAQRRLGVDRVVLSMLIHLSFAMTAHIRAHPPLHLVHLDT